MKSIKKISAFLVFFVLPLPTLANSTRGNQVYYISSDSATLDKTNHTATFSGHVSGQHGDTRLNGQRITLHLSKNNNQILQLTDYGTPATYFTNPINTQEHIHAQAGIIDYHPLKNEVSFTNKVSITQGQSEMTGAFITYNTKQKTIESKPIQGNQRTTMTFKPKNAS